MDFPPSVTIFYLRRAEAQRFTTAFLHKKRRFFANFQFLFLYFLFKIPFLLDGWTKRLYDTICNKFVTFRWDTNV